MDCVHLQIDLQATTGYKDCIFGGEATFDTNKQDVTKWSAGVGATQNSHCEGPVAHPSASLNQSTLKGIYTLLAGIALTTWLPLAASKTDTIQLTGFVALLMMAKLSAQTRLWQAERSVT